MFSPVGPIQSVHHHFGTRTAGSGVDEFGETSGALPTGVSRHDVRTSNITLLRVDICSSCCIFLSISEAVLASITL
jgi:hypothetical protein